MELAKSMSLQWNISTAINLRCMDLQKDVEGLMDRVSNAEILKKIG